MKRSSYGKVLSCCKGTNSLLHAAIIIWLLSSCTGSRKIAKQVNSVLLQDSSIGTGHVGISIYEPATGTYLYNHNATKYFIPASTAKLFTLYAGMKYLGDSLVGLRYKTAPGVCEDCIAIQPTGDPTFLHPDFLKQPVFDFLKKQHEVYLDNFNIDPYGKGWAWDDYKEPFMRPRSDFPVYNNLIGFTWVNQDSLKISPSFFERTTKKYKYPDKGFKTYYHIGENEISIFYGEHKTELIPFPLNFKNIRGLLKDTISNLSFQDPIHPLHYRSDELVPIYSQPTDSLLKPMMHNSDNFFAEQTLLMVSNEHLGYMDDETIIDTLLKSDLKDVPQQPRWVDGSGLSRYNLFTPQSFVYILTKLKNEFGLERLKRILPTGGEGTLKNYYNTDSGFIYAKTGSMGNQVTLCGYLMTKKNRLLVFSILVNNEMGSAAGVRRAMERFISGIRNDY